MRRSSTMTASDMSALRIARGGQRRPGGCAAAPLTHCPPANEAAGHAGVARPTAGEPSGNDQMAQPVHSGLRWTSAVPTTGCTRLFAGTPGSNPLNISSPAWAPRAAGRMIRTTGSDGCLGNLATPGAVLTMRIRSCGVGRIHGALGKGAAVR